MLCFYDLQSIVSKQHYERQHSLAVKNVNYSSMSRKPTRDDDTCRDQQWNETIIIPRTDGERGGNIVTGTWHELKPWIGGFSPEAETQKKTDSAQVQQTGRDQQQGVWRVKSSTFSLSFSFLLVPAIGLIRQETKGPERRQDRDEQRIICWTEFGYGRELQRYPAHTLSSIILYKDGS